MKGNVPCDVLLCGKARPILGLFRLFQNGFRENRAHCCCFRDRAVSQALWTCCCGVKVSAGVSVCTPQSQGSVMSLTERNMTQFRELFSAPFLVSRIAATEPRVYALRTLVLTLVMADPRVPTRSSRHCSGCVCRGVSG